MIKKSIAWTVAILVATVLTYSALDFLPGTTGVEQAGDVITNAQSSHLPYALLSLSSLCFLLVAWAEPFLSLFKDES